MKSWKDFIIGMVVGVAGLFAVVLCYFRFGFAPVAATAAPMPLERYFAQAAMKNSVSQAADVRPPIENTEANLLAGARTYRSTCAVCHSLPGRDRTAIEKGMYPRPPELLVGTGVTDDPVGSTHWVIRNGIRMSGMPSFARTLSDEQLWQVAQLLANAHNLPPSVTQLLSQPDSVQIGSGHTSNENVGSAPY